MYIAMSAPTWMQRIRKNRELADRRKFWESIVPRTKLIYVEQESGVLGLNVETFQLRDGSTFEDVRKRISAIRNALETQSACVCPVGVVLDSGDENLGTISLEGFRIVWSDKQYLPSIFDESISQHERDFITRIELIPKLSEDETIGYCPLLHARMVTDGNSSEKVVVVSVVSKSGGRISDFDKMKGYIKEKYHARLVEFFNDGEFDSSMIVSIVISAKDKQADTQEVSFITTGTIPIAKGIKSAQKIIKVMKEV